MLLQGHLGDLEFVVMDTGGLEDKGPSDPISSKMLQHTSVAIARADAVLFMIDAREGVTDEDVTFVRCVPSASAGGRPGCAAGWLAALPDLAALELLATHVCVRSPWRLLQVVEATAAGRRHPPRRQQG